MVENPATANRDPTSQQPSSVERDALRGALRFLLLSLLVALLYGLWLVFRPFIIPLLWAVIITTATWPAYRRLRRLCPQAPSVAPLVSTFILAAVFLLAVLPLPLRATSELRDFAQSLQGIDVTRALSMLREIPMVGPLIAETVSPVLTESRSLASLLEGHSAKVLLFAGSAARGMLITGAHLIATLVGCYIFYRHGEGLVAQLNNALRRVAGERTSHVLDAIEPTVRGAAYSVVATAAAQGTLAGLGYYVAGAPMPLLLGALTGIIALIPFGPPFIYLPVAGYLSLLTPLPWYHAVGIILWGVLVVSAVDNVLRPLFISQATSGSPVLVFIGVLGGVLAFGLLGVFAGPAIIAIAQLLWRDLAQPEEPAVRA